MNTKQIEALVELLKMLVGDLPAGFQRRAAELITLLAPVAESVEPAQERCADCNTPLGAGEARCFTVCAACWNRIYRDVEPARARGEAPRTDCCTGAPNCVHNMTPVEARGESFPWDNDFGPGYTPTDDEVAEWKARSGSAPSCEWCANGIVDISCQENNLTWVKQRYCHCPRGVDAKKRGVPLKTSAEDEEHAREAFPPGRGWRCEACGEMAEDVPGTAWRWAGDRYQHSHGQAGHFDARFFGEPAREAEPTITTYCAGCIDLRVRLAAAEREIAAWERCAGIVVMAADGCDPGDRTPDALPRLVAGRITREEKRAEAAERERDEASAGWADDRRKLLASDRRVEELISGIERIAASVHNVTKYMIKRDLKSLAAALAKKTEG